MSVITPATASPAGTGFVVPLTNMLIIDCGRRNHEVITASIEDVLLWRDGISLEDLGNRYEKAQQLFERGGWKAPKDDPGGAWLVDSQELATRRADRSGPGNLQYQVYCKGLPAHRELGYANNCFCYDSTNEHGQGAGGKLGGWCKHQLVVMIAHFAAVILLAEWKKRQTPARREGVAA
jgi:hypothetical protein